MTNSASVNVVSPADLPASCPPAAQWDRHPRVYLQLSAQKPRCACPYCGAQYALANAETAEDKP